MRKALAIVGKAAPYLIAAAAVCFYAYVQVINFTPAYHEPDPDGYIVLAKRMVHGGPLDVPDEDPFRHQSHVWVDSRSGGAVPKFSPGYPALLAIGYLLGGDHGMFWVSPLLGGLALVGGFLLFRLWMSAWASAIATAAMALHAMLLFYNGYLLTHAANLCFVTWGMYFLWKWKRKPSIVSGIAAGLVLGYAAAIRHTSALLVGVVVVAVIAGLVEGRKRLGRNLLRAGVLLAAYAVFPLVLAWYNQHLFGDVFTTGYARSGEQAAFTVKNYFANFETILKGLREGPVFPIFVLGLAGMLVAGGWSDKLMRLLWFVPIYLIYASYYWARSDPPFSRFYIATVPVFFGSAYLLMDLAKVRTAVKVVGMAAVCGIVAFGWRDGLEAAVLGGMYGPGQRQLAEAADFASAELDDAAVIFTRHAPQYHVGTRKNFRLYTMDAFSTRRKRAFRKWLEPGTAEWYGQSWYAQSAPRQQPERIERFRAFYDSTSDEELRTRQRELVRSFLEQGRQVVFFLPVHEAGGCRGLLGKDFDVTTIREERLFGGRWGLHQVSFHHADLHAKAGPLREALGPIELRLERGQAVPPRELEVTVPNPFDQPLTGRLRWRTEDGSAWRAPAGPMDIRIEPGKRRTVSLPVPPVRGSRRADVASLLRPAPVGEWTLRVGDRVLWLRRETPVVINEWPYADARAAMRAAVNLDNVKPITPDTDTPEAVELKLVNPTAWRARYTLTWRCPPRCRWKVEAASAAVELEPGAKVTKGFRLSFEGSPSQVFPLPKLVSTVAVDGEGVLEVAARPRVSARELLSKGQWSAECARANARPRIDGRLDDAVWKNCPVLRDFVTGAGQPAGQDTEVRLAYDDRNLYLAFRCFEENLPGLLTEVKVHDQWVWQDDSVELLLDMNRDKRSYFHLVFNAAGVLADAVAQWRRDWDAPCTVKGGREADAWTLEIALPWKSLAAEPPEPGTTIGLELARNRMQDPREASQWAPTFRGNHAPDRFGTLTFK